MFIWLSFSLTSRLGFLLMPSGPPWSPDASHVVSSCHQNLECLVLGGGIVAPPIKMLLFLCCEGERWSNTQYWFHWKLEATNQASQKRRIMSYNKQASFVLFYKASSTIVKTALPEPCHLLCNIMLLQQPSH